MEEKIKTPSSDVENDSIEQTEISSEEVVQDGQRKQDSHGEQNWQVELEKANEEIKNLQNEIRIQKEHFLRLAAEYDNYRKRSEKDKITIYSDAKAKIIFEILTIADCIERAIEASSEADEEYQKGLKMLSDQFNSTLSKLGVEAFGNEGDKFNPEIHNAISHIEDDELGENVISKIFQKGYKLGDKIVRHAMVSVAN